MDFVYGAHRANHTFICRDIMVCSTSYLNIKVDFQSIRSIIQPVQQLNILFMDYLVYLIIIWQVLDYMGRRIDT
jgi:hypothetical protein